MCHLIATPNESLQVLPKCALNLDGQGHQASAKLVARRPLFLALSALCYLCCLPCVVGGGLCQCIYYLRGDGPIHDNGLSRVDVMDEKVPTALAESRETLGFSSAATHTVVAMSRSVCRRWSCRHPNMPSFLHVSR